MTYVGAARLYLEHDQWQQRARTWKPEGSSACSVPGCPGTGAGALTHLLALGFGERWRRSRDAWRGGSTTMRTIVGNFAGAFFL